MSQLLDAIDGVPNACEPIHGIVTGGQPTLEHLAALKRAGGEVVIDLGNRVGVALIPYFMLEQGMEEEDAVTAAMRVGMRSAELMAQALEYVRSRQGI